MDSNVEEAAKRLMSMEMGFCDEDDLEVDTKLQDMLSEQICSNNATLRLAGIKSLRRRTSKGSCSFHRLLQGPTATTALANCLSHDAGSEMQLEAAIAITNLLSSCTTHAKLLHNTETIPALVSLLKSEANHQVKEQVCWALANFAGKDTEARDRVIEAGLSEAMQVVWSSSPPPEVLDAASLILVNIFRDSEPPVSYSIAVEFLEQIQCLFNQQQQDQKSALQPNLLWAISYMIEDKEERIKLLLNDEMMPRLRQFLLIENTEILVPTLRIFSNISAGMRQLPDSVLAGDLLQAMRKLLQLRDPTIRRQILFFLSNISDGPDHHLQAIADAELLPEISKILLNSTEGEQREAFWLLPNFCLTRGPHFKNLLIDNCLESLLHLIDLEDVEITQAVLMTLHDLLNSARYKFPTEMDFDDLKKKIQNFGGLSTLEQFNSNKDQTDELKSMSFQIIDQFFAGNEQKYRNNNNPESSSEEPQLDDEVEN